MKYRKFLMGAVLSTLGLLVAVMLVQWTLQLVTGKTVTAAASFSRRALVAGLIADSIRGAILSYAYPRTINAGISYSHAIWFGTLASLLVATLWVVYQFGVRPALGISFLIEETTIILFQGLFSGLALGWVYKK
jgi:hypothetical protein